MRLSAGRPPDGPAPGSSSSGGGVVVAAAGATGSGLGSTCGESPLLWRLDYYGIDMSKNAVPLLKYAERIFSRPAYIEALTPSEKVMRK